MKVPVRTDLLWRTWRILWLVAVAVIFAQAIYVRCGLPPWPILSQDSGYYLNPALTGKIDHIGPRTIPYPLFCWALFAATGDWRSIVVAQQVLGLLGPALLLFAWFCLGARIYASRLARAGHEALGLALPLLLLPSSTYVLYGQMVMLESFNAFLQCCLGALFCLLWMPARPRQRLLVASATAFLAIVMYYANPRWGAAAPVCVLLAVIAADVGRDRLRRRFPPAGLVLASAFAAWLLLGLPQAVIHGRNPGTGAFTAKVLLWMHAHLAVNEFRRDLAAVPPPPNAALLRTLVDKITPTLTGQGGWATIPFHAESMMYGAGNPDGDLIAAFPGDADGYARFCLHYYRQIIWHQPGAFAAQVWLELKYFYTDHGGALLDFTGPLQAYWLQSASMARALAFYARPKPQAELLRAVEKWDQLSAKPLAFTSYPALADLDQVINGEFWWMTLSGTAGALVVISFRKLRANQGLFMAANLCLAANLILFFQVLTLALVTAAAPRYAEAVRTLVVFSVVCQVLLAAHFLGALGRKLFGRAAARARVIAPPI